MASAAGRLGPILGGVLLLALMASPTGAQSVALERCDATGVALRVKFGLPHRASLDVGGITIPVAALPGTGPRLEPGRPIVPLRRVLVEIPGGVSVALRAEVGVMRRAWLGELPPLPRPRAPDASPAWLDVSAVPLADEPWARIAWVGFLRARRVALVEMLPVHPHPDGYADVAGELSVELRFGGVATMRADPARDGPDFERLYTSSLVNAGAYGGSGVFSGLTAGASSPHPGLGGDWCVKLSVDTAGLFAVTGAHLAAAGVRPSTVHPERLALSCGGEPIAILVEGEADGSLDPGDRILFYGEPVSSPYTATNIYWLTEAPPVAAVGGPAAIALRMKTLDGTPQAGAPEPWFRERTRAGTDLLYWQFLPDGAGKDHWFWTKTLAPATTDFGIPLESPVAGSGSITVRAALHGYTDTVQSPDHHTRVLLNGAQVDDRSWDGMVPLLHEATAAPNLLLAGVNTVSVEQVADTGALVDGIYADWVEIEYDRAFVAASDVLAFAYSAAGPVDFEVLALTQPQARVFDVSDAKRPRLVTGAVATPDGPSYKLAFHVDPGAGSRWFVVGEPAIQEPLSVERAEPAIAPPSQGADLVIIAPHEYWPALDPLVALRQARGLRVALFDVLDIYDAHAHGLVDPSALQRFLEEACATWPAPAPSYVLLVGEASVDYLDHLGNHVPNTAPTWLYESFFSGEIPTDNLYACVAGDDPLPDLYIGRLPAGTVADVEAMVSKIVANETAPPPGTWTQQIVHVADHGSDFASVLDALAVQHVPAPYAVTSVHADDFGSTAMAHAAIVSEWNAGALIITYLGHGSVKKWGTGLFQNSQVNELANGGRLPFVIALNCLNGYYASPTDVLSLGEILVAHDKHGAVASASASGFGIAFEQQPLATSIYAHIFPDLRPGPAITGGKIGAYLDWYVIEDNLWSFTLLGDPASTLAGSP